MNKWLTLTLILLLSSGGLFAQEDSIAQIKQHRKSFLFYKHLYKSADSLTITGQVGFLNKDIYRVADSLDKLHPLEYFTKAGKLLASNNLNDASFIFYLGCLRYRYYNSVNPNYEASSDGALFASLDYSIGEPFYMFLKANINNYIGIVKKSIEWYSNHEYKFYVDSKSKEKYLFSIKELNNSVVDLEKNKDKYQEAWEKERQKSEKSFDDTLKEPDKQLKKTK